jgi:hypothetical protein
MLGRGTNIFPTEEIENDEDARVPGLQRKNLNEVSEFFD